MRPKSDRPKQDRPKKDRPGPSPSPKPGPQKRREPSTPRQNPKRRSRLLSTMQPPPDLNRSRNEKQNRNQNQEPKPRPLSRQKPNTRRQNPRQPSPRPSITKAWLEPNQSPNQSPRQSPRKRNPLPSLGNQHPKRNPSPPSPQRLNVRRRSLPKNPSLHPSIMRARLAPKAHQSPSIRARLVKRASLHLRKRSHPDSSTTAKSAHPDAPVV